MPSDIAWWWHLAHRHLKQPLLYLRKFLNHLCRRLLTMTMYKNASEFSSRSVLLSSDLMSIKQFTRQLLLTTHTRTEFSIRQTLQTTERVTWAIIQFVNVDSLIWLYFRVTSHFSKRSYFQWKKVYFINCQHKTLKYRWFLNQSPALPSGWEEICWD